MVIPEYNQVREGDILVNNGYTLSEVAIVTGVDEKKSGRSGISVVCMEEKTGGSAVLKTWSDLENPENFCARRLLKQKANADSAFVWGKRNFRVGKSVSDSKIKDYLISVDKDKKSKIATYEYKIPESGYIQIMSITEMNYAGFWRCYILTMLSLVIFYTMYLLGMEQKMVPI